MFKLLSKSKYPNEMIYFLTELTLIIHVQFIIGSKRQTSCILKKSFENVSEDFVSDIILKRLKFDYSPSETISNQRIKLRAIFCDCVFLEIRLTYVNQLLQNILRNK